MARHLALLVALLLLASGVPATARTLMVGPGEVLAKPSDAARVARDGDEVLIAPGTYYDCAIWHANRLTITAAEGAAGGAGVVLTDVACAGKAAFVIDGDDVTVRGITFTRIRVPDDNGAGIRAEGGSLTVENCAFINNQAAILTASRPGAVLRVVGSRFEANGECDGDRCSDTLMVGRLAGLEVAASRFTAPRGGLAIDSEAGWITLRNDYIEGGADGLVRLVVVGPVLLEGNTLVQQGEGWAVLLTGGEAPVAVRGNRYRQQGGEGTMLLNWSGADPLMQDNVVATGDAALSSRGAWWEALRLGAHAVYDPAHALAGKVKSKLQELGGKGLGRLRHLLPF